jgi:Tol biopolymer transport system component
MPALSPNGKWLAYTSFESGEAQIYLTEFPQARGKWQVSGEAGYDPRWSPGGKKLFFKTNGKLFVTDVHEGGVPRFGTPLPTPLDADTTLNTIGYAILKDGRILSLAHAGSAPARTIHLITNWTKLLPP